MLEVAWDQGVGTMVLTSHLRPIDGPDKEESIAKVLTGSKKLHVPPGWRSTSTWDRRSPFASICLRLPFGPRVTLQMDATF